MTKIPLPLLQGRGGGEQDGGALRADQIRRGRHHSPQGGNIQPEGNYQLTVI